MIITQVHLVLGTIEGHSKMCSFVTQHNARAVARELNVHSSTISHLQRRFREYGSTSNQPQPQARCIPTCG